MSFRQRLALFLIAALICVQAVTAVLAYGVVRRNLVEEATRELKGTTAVFMRQLNILSERVSDDVEVLSLDYALRKAVAEHDEGTALSALRNHGNRIGATRMMLIGLDGVVTTDTAGRKDEGKPFPFAMLLNPASAGGQGTALAVLDGGIYWTVVVPVKAPVPIAFVAASVPVNDTLLEKLQTLSPIPQSLALATQTAHGWRIVAKTRDYAPDIKLAAAGSLPAGNAVIATEEHGDRLTMRARLAVAAESAPIAAILDYPLEQVLSSYRAILTPMLLVFAGASAAALVGAIMIARSISQPLELLAAAAGRIAKGDYAPPDLKRSDEIGQLSLALGDMTRAIAEREAALKAALASVECARKEAVTANETKSQFLSNMSHELRTPLNAIIGFSEMIHRQVMGPLNIARYGEYARHVYDSGRHLLTQVEEMLDLSEAESGQLMLARAPVSAGDILRDALADAAPAAEKAGIALDGPADSGHWPTFDGDHRKLCQSLGNILANAIKFSPRGSRVTLAADVMRGMLEITVADRGSGIAAEDLALVLRPFHRRRKAFDARHQGAGLGLPFAKTIVEAHGGSLTLASREGEGTVVTIVLPLAADANRDSLTDAA